MMLYTEAQQVQHHAHGVCANMLPFALLFLLPLPLLLLLTAGAWTGTSFLACCLHEGMYNVAQLWDRGSCTNVDAAHVFGHVAPVCCLYNPSLKP